MLYLGYLGVWGAVIVSHLAADSMPEHRLPWQQCSLVPSPAQQDTIMMCHAGILKVLLHSVGCTCKALVRLSCLCTCHEQANPNLRICGVQALSIHCGCESCGKLL